MPAGCRPVYCHMSHHAKARLEYEWEDDYPHLHIFLHSAKSITQKAKAAVSESVTVSLPGHRRHGLKADDLKSCSV